MNPNETKVVLSYHIVGAQLQYGEYNYIEKTSSGDMLPESRRLRIIKEPVYDPCIKKIVLGPEFVKHALSSRPHYTENFEVYKRWGKMSDEQRLDYHIRKFVYDQGATKYEYEII